ncbi:MFS transporter [Streptomyces sp. NPDC059717]|uniref:MFS transporter n=1 Tax=Streptomyces sp. NPDC059717 TaxID=3346922 RepID=UPI00368D8E87
MAIPEVLRNRDFDLYWGGVVFSQIGTRGAVAANLYQVYQLTGSTAQVGLVGLAQAVALLVLSPVGGIYADRLDRRRLLQVTQGVALLVSAALAAITLAGAATVWSVVVSSLLATAAATFDQPARQAQIPAFVAPRPAGVAGGGGATPRGGGPGCGFGGGGRGGRRPGPAGRGAGPATTRR